jgi:hypothetical protein
MMVRRLYIASLLELSFAPRIATALPMTTAELFISRPSALCTQASFLYCSCGRDRSTQLTCCHLAIRSCGNFRLSFLVSSLYLVRCVPPNVYLAPLVPYPHISPLPLFVARLLGELASCIRLFFVSAMSAFSYPPPPPPPPAANAPPPPLSNLRGGFGNSRGGRGRGRGNNRGGGQRGGFSHSRGAPAYNSGGLQSSPPSSGYPLPNYPQWQQPVGTTQTPYQAPYQAPHTQQPAQYSTQSYTYPPAVQSFGHAAAPQMGQASMSMPPSYSAQSSYYGHGLPTAPPVPQPTTQAPLMGPPIRWGFDRPQSAGRGNVKGQNHGSPNPFPGGGNKRKRDHSSRGFHTSQPSPNDSGTMVQKPQSLPKVQVAPAVPTFGFSLPPKPPPLEGAPSEKSRKKRKRKQNQLGLTPKGEVHEDTDEDDIDEEAAFLQAGQPSVSLSSIGSSPPCANKSCRIEISHAGQTLLLKSESDIAVWIAERKKRFPTQANIEVKKALAAAEKQKRQEQKDRFKQERAAQHAANLEKKHEERKAKKSKSKSKSVKMQPDGDPLKAESIPDDPQLRIAYLEEQLRLAKEAATQPTTITASPLLDDVIKLDAQARVDHAAEGQVEGEVGTATSNISPRVTAEALDHPSMPDLGLSYNSGDHDSATSSSASESSSDVTSDDSDDNSEAAPEEVSSKTHNPIKVLPPKRANPNDGNAQTRVCGQFRSSGYCKFGKKCKYLHEQPTRIKAKREPTNTVQPRKSLYEMVSFSFSSNSEMSANTKSYLAGKTGVARRGYARPPSHKVPWPDWLSRLSGRYSTFVVQSFMSLSHWPGCLPSIRQLNCDCVSCFRNQKNFSQRYQK